MPQCGIRNIAHLIESEERAFGVTLDKGIDRFEELASRVEKSKSRTIDGGEAYDLYATYGFPMDLVELMARERGLVLVHPFDDERVIAGQGTVALEMLEQQPDLEVLLIPVGGGGLISGCAIAVHGISPEIEIVGVQTTAFPALQQILAGEPVQTGGGTVAEGIAVAEPGRLTREIAREHVREILLVEEEALETAVGTLATYPPLVFAGECDVLKDRMAAVSGGEAFVLTFLETHGGDGDLFAHLFDAAQYHVLTMWLH